MCLETVESVPSLRGDVYWGLVTADLDDSGIDSHKGKLHNLLRNPCLCLCCSVALNIKHTKVLSFKFFKMSPSLPEE